MKYLVEGDGFWSKDHDGEGNLETIDTGLDVAISGVADNAADIAAHAITIAAHTGQIATNTSGVTAAKAMADTGYIGQARFTFGGVNAIAGETITIGAEIYEFGGVGIINVNVAIGLNVEATINNLVTAINTNTTENVFAEKESATVMALWNAATPGGTPANGTSTCALSETIAAATNVWSQSNMNVTGRAAYTNQTSDIMVATALNITAAFTVELPFSPVDVQWYVRDGATGLLVPTSTAVITFMGAILTFDLAAGIVPMAAGDLMYWVARG